jgi:hypothetical protein
MKLAPIVLFVYSRLEHTKQTIEALQKNTLAKESDIFIYSDAPKNKNAQEKVKQVREFIDKVDGFKNITIIKQEANKGLASSIISGVSHIVKKFGKVIVVEDDLVTSPYFLSFMNDALNFYENKKKVWHISGWSYPTKFCTKEQMYFYRTMDCWGWATWADRWSYFEKNTSKLVKNFSKRDIKKFNLDGYNNIWIQVLMNKYKQIDTWAIYWCANIFEKKGMCVNPVQSFVRNIGFDGGGEHCSDPDYKDNLVLNQIEKIVFSEDIKEDKNIIEQIKSYYKSKKKPFIVRAINKVWRIVFGKNLFVKKNS